MQLNECLKVRPVLADSPYILLLFTLRQKRMKNTDTAITLEWREFHVIRVVHLANLVTSFC